VSPDAIQLEASDIHREAAELGVPVRLIGSLAIAYRCPTARPLMATLGRRPPRDMDFMAYSAHEGRLHSLLSQRGYALHPAIRHSREWGVKRLIYTHAEHEGKVDIFLDQLVMAHTIDFRGRLEREAVTVSLADLLLTKLQIYRITENDLIDLTVLLAETDLGPESDEIDVTRVQSVLSDDWGFWHGATLNLDRLADRLDGTDNLDVEVRARIRDRIARLRHSIEAAPKSVRWRVRSRIGTRAGWYEHVDDVED
jgi:hypothetical protein